jgi:hypothetical protein
VFSAESLPARCPSGRSLRPVPLAMAIPGWLYFWVRQLQCHQIFIVNLDFDSVIFWGLGIEIHIERVQTLQIGLKSRFEATKLILVPDIFIQVEGSSYSWAPNPCIPQVFEYVFTWFHHELNCYNVCPLAATGGDLASSDGVLKLIKRVSLVYIICTMCKYINIYIYNCNNYCYCSFQHCDYYCYHYYYIYIYTYIYIHILYQILINSISMYYIYYTHLQPHGHYWAHTDHGIRKSGHLQYEIIGWSRNVFRFVPCSPPYTHTHGGRSRL